MDTIYIKVPGQPKSQSRHKHFTRGNYSGVYDPSADEKQSFLAYIVPDAPAVPLEGPIELLLVFYMKRPKGHYGTGKNSGSIKPNAPYYCSKKPDIDNMIKFVTDAMNSIFWKDDAQICKITAQKIYSVNPHVAIWITENYVNNE